MPSVQLALTNQTPQAVAAAYFEAAKMQMEAAMVKIEARARLNAPSRTGHLRRGLTHIVRTAGSTITGQLGVNVTYGIFVERGTGLYGPFKQRIYPKRASVMRFPTPGNKSFTSAGRQRRGKAGANASWVYARSIKGMHPTHFMSNAITQTAAEWKFELQQIATVAQSLLAHGHQKRVIRHQLPGKAAS